MADKQNMSDEDYLDSLLRSITEAENKNNIEYEDEDESDFAKALEEEIGIVDDEDAFLSDIENDLFANGDSSFAKQNTGEYDISFGDSNTDLGITDENNDSLDLNVIEERPIKKKEKKGLFGRNKKIVISDEEESNDANVGNVFDAINANETRETTEASDINNLNEIADTLENIPSMSKINFAEDNSVETNSVENKLTLNNSAEDNSVLENSVEENVKSDIENFDDFSLDFGNDFDNSFDESFNMDFDNGSNTQSENNDNESKIDENPESNVNDLMNIMGITPDSEAFSSEELGDKAEKSKKKKKKKDKKKIGFFSRKKEDNDLEDNKINDSNNVSNDGIQNADSFENAYDTTNDSNMINIDDVANNFESEDYSFGLDMNFDNDESQEMDENENLIRQMDMGEFDEEEILNEEELKKDKKKKKKKEKKPKKQKTKKAKKPKVKKVKVKKPKEPDEIIKIPKVFVIISLSLVVLLTIVLIFGGNLKYYNDKMQRATAFYVNKDFEAAYSEIAGLSIKEKDEDFYNQVFTVMLVSHQYSSGKNLLAIGDYEQSLHSFLKGIAMFDKYQNQARDLNCFDEMSIVLEQINKELTEVFGITESKAREINLLDDREEYSYRVKVLAKEIMEKNQEE